MAPLFPPHALDLGLTETQIGLAQGMFDIASFIGQFMIASVITPQTRKMFYAVGIFVSGVLVFFNSARKIHQYFCTFGYVYARTFSASQDQESKVDNYAKLAKFVQKPVSNFGDSL